MPVGAETFAEALRMGAEMFHALKALLHGRGLATAVGDEGGFAPDLGSADEAIEAILEAADSAGHRDVVAIALDPASTELYRDGAYHLEGEERSPVPGGDGRLLGRPGWTLPDRLDRGRPGRGRLGRMAAPHRAPRRPDPARGRRPFRHQHRAPQARHRRRTWPTRS